MPHQPNHFNANVLGQVGQGGGFLSRGSGAGANPAINPFFSGPGFATGGGNFAGSTTPTGPAFVPPPTGGGFTGTSGTVQQGAQGGGQFAVGASQPNPLNTPQNAQALMQAIQQFLPGFQVSPNAGFAFTGDGADFRGNLLDANAGFFQGDPFGLPSREAGTTAGFVANLLQGQAASQQPRAQEAEGLLRQIMQQLADPQTLGLNARSVDAGNRFVTQAGSDERRQLLTDQARRDTAQQRNDSFNSARDLGLLGQGGASRDVNAQIQNLAGQGFSNRLFDIENQLFAETGAAGQLGTGIAGQSGQNLQTLLQNPALALSGRLDRAQNQGVGPLIEFLAQLPAIQANQAIATSGNTFFEDASPILEALISGGSKLGAAKIAAG